jgi:Flp pilus assembly protein TadG
MRSKVFDEHSLFRDDRGAIMVIGLFMFTFLIGACWYVFGIGNAISYRENLQNAADSTAFAAAVYNARGMNILVMVNLVMAAVMAVLVAAKAAQVLLLGINLITCALSETLVAIPICAATTEAEPEMEEFVDETVAPPVIATEKVLHYTEGALAVVWPWLSEGKSTAASLDYQPGVLFGTTMATAQIPLGLSNAGDFSSLITNAIGFNFSGKGSPVSFNLKNNITNGLDSGFSGRYGLPVENDSLNDLCSMAASTVFDVVSLPIDLIPGAGTFMKPILDALNTAIKYLAGNFAFYFCESTPTGLKDVAESLIGWGSKKGAFNIVNDTVPKRLYSNSSMGDENFAVWSNVVGNWTVDANQLAVGVAGRFGKTPSVVGPPPADVALGVAKAEFYYEPQVGEAIKDPEISMTTLTTVISGQNCMWNMRWRARLRRYTQMSGGLFSSYSGSKLIQGLFNGALGQIVKGLPGMPSVQNNPALKGALNGIAQDVGFNPYSNNCNSPSSPNGFANGDPLWYVKEALNPLCAAYALTSLGTNTLLQGASPGSIGNLTPPLPGVYH